MSGNCATSSSLALSALDALHQSCPNFRPVIDDIKKQTCRPHGEHIRHLPVVNGGVVLGVLSVRDLMGSLIDHRQVALALAHELVHEALGRTNAHESADHHCCEVGDQRCGVLQ